VHFRKQRVFTLRTGRDRWPSTYTISTAGNYILFVINIKTVIIIYTSTSFFVRLSLPLHVVYCAAAIVLIRLIRRRFRVRVCV